MRRVDFLAVWFALRLLRLLVLSLLSMVCVRCVVAMVPYMKIHLALIVKAGNPKSIKGPEDLSGKTVSVQANTKSEKYLKTLNAKFKASGKSQMNLQSSPGDEDPVAKILLGRADA